MIMLQLGDLFAVRHCSSVRTIQVDLNLWYFALYLVRSYQWQIEGKPRHDVMGKL